jgi:hypothetical protein
LIVFRGFYDPTSLLENANHLVTDDILEYYPNFSFSADYSRSLCRYWNWFHTENNYINFSTEVNWPGYNNYPPKTLVKYWSMQLHTFYEKGASSLFLAHWGTIGSRDKIPEKIKSGFLKTSYKAWQDTLSSYKNKPIKIITNNIAFHLACEQGLSFRIETEFNDSQLHPYTQNTEIVVGKVNGKDVYEFPLKRFSSLPRINGDKNFYNGNGDFATNYMLKNSPGYLKENYKQFFLTGTSVFIDKSIHINFE